MNEFVEYSAKPHLAVEGGTGTHIGMYFGPSDASSDTLSDRGAFFRRATSSTEKSDGRLLLFDRRCRSKDGFAEVMSELSFRGKGGVEGVGGIIRTHSAYVL